MAPFTKEELLALLADETLTPEGRTAYIRVLETILANEREERREHDLRIKPESIPKFSGKHGNDIVLWFMNLAAIFACANLTASYKVTLAITGLTLCMRWWTHIGEPKYNLLRENDPNADAFDVFQRVLKERFADPFGDSKARNVIFGLKQGDKTLSRLLEIFYENLAIVNEELSDEMKKFILRKALTERLLNAIPANVWSLSFQQVVDAALQAEQNIKWSSGTWLGNAFQNGRNFFQNNYTPMELGHFFVGNGRGQGNPNGGRGAPHNQNGGRGFPNGGGHGFSNGGRGFPTSGRGFPQGGGRFPSNGGGRGRGRMSYANMVAGNQTTRDNFTPNDWSCHECGSLDHFVRNCPVRKAKMEEKRWGKMAMPPEPREPLNDNNDEAGPSDFA